MITWNDSMTTGVPAIDAQHKELIQRYNTFAEALSNSLLARDEAGKMLDFLQFYAVWHFEREEQYFDEYKCPFAEQNKCAHADFIQQFGAFYEEWQTEGMDTDLIQETFAAFGNWIENHICKIDVQIRSCV